MQTLTINGLYKEVNMVDAVQAELQQLTSRYQGILCREPFNELVEQLEYWLGQYRQGSLHAMEFLTHDGRAMLNELKRRVRATLSALRDEPQFAAVKLDKQGHGCFAQTKPVVYDDVDLDAEPTEEDEPDTYELVAGAKTYNTFSRVH